MYPRKFIFFMLILSSCILVTGCMSEMSETRQRLCFSDSMYEVSIDVSEEITNVTFFLPLPVKTNMPMTGALEIDEDQFNKENFSVNFIQVPPETDMTNAYAIKDNQPWFLRIHADRILSDPSGKSEYSIDIDNHTSAPSTTIFSNTLFPLGNESVFLPKIDYTQPPLRLISTRSPEWIEYGGFQQYYKIPIFADYSASPTTHVEIQSRIRESNGWVEPAIPNTVYTGIDGGGNYYTDSYAWTNYGEFHGWTIVKGELSAPDNVFPNLNNPAWQKVLNQHSK